MFRNTKLQAAAVLIVGAARLPGRVREGQPLLPRRSSDSAARRRVRAGARARGPGLPGLLLRRCRQGLLPGETGRQGGGRALRQEALNERHPMDKDQVAAILDEIGTLLELQGRKSLSLQRLPNGGPRHRRSSTRPRRRRCPGQLGEIPGIGETLRDKITTLVTTGQLPFYEDLQAGDAPRPAADAAHARDWGPRRSRPCTISSASTTSTSSRRPATPARSPSSRASARRRRRRSSKASPSSARPGQPRPPRSGPAPGPDACSTACGKCPGVQRMELCGSLRRRKETIKDIDILISSRRCRADHGRFVKLPGVKRIIGHGETKSSVTVSPTAQGHHERRPARRQRRAVPVRPELLHRQQGAQRRLRQRAIALRAEAQRIRAGRAEEKRRRARTRPTSTGPSTCDYVAAGAARGHRRNRRRRRSTVAAADRARDDPGHLPLPHDLAATVPEPSSRWPRPPKASAEIPGHRRPFAIADRGQRPESRARPRSSKRDRRAQRKNVKGIHLFKGTECDILADGRLDFDDELLATFDYVVASVHSHFNQTQGGDDRPHHQGDPAIRW